MPGHDTGARRLILVAYSVAPGPGGPEGIVNARLLRALAEYWPAGVSVISAGGPPLDRCGVSLAERPGWRFHIGDGALSGFRNRQSILYRCLNRAVWEMTGEGLKGQGWMRFAQRALEEELARHPGAIVYSRALPYTSIEAVRRVRARRAFRWIVNINDPLPPDIWPGQYGFEAKTCEAMRRTMRRAMPHVDAFTFPCAQLSGIETAEFEDLNRLPRLILPHLPGASSSDSAARTDTRLHIAYAGTMGRGRVRPEFAAAIDEFARTEPRLAGQVRFSFYLNHANRFALEFIEKLPVETSVFVGLPHDECDAALRSADLLLDISADVDAPLLMTKIATYVGTGKPLWAVCHRGGTSWNLLERGWGYASDTTSPENIRATLREILADWSAGSLRSRRPADQIAARFTAGRHIADLLQLCQYITGPDGRDRPPCLKIDWP